MRLPMHWLVAAAGAAAAFGLALPAQAAPTGAVTGNAAAVQEVGTSVEQVRHRCYKHRGHWHCPKHRRNYNDFYYGYAPYYYGPGINLYLGGGRHHHHRHRGHRHR